MIIGHRFQLEYLRKIAERGEIPHAFLFSGEKKLGKKKVALEFVKMLFGPDSGRKIDRGIHPDFVLIEPEGSIQISRIRKLNSFFGFRPSLAPLKAAVIDEAHLMNGAAQSALLKVLEEPKGFTLFILVTSLPRQLLPTIVSRTQPVNFYRVPKAEAALYLKEQKITKKDSDLLLDVYDGRPGEIIDFISDPRKLKEREKLAREAEELIGSDLASRFKYAENLSKDSGKAGEVLDFWLKHFRKKLLSSPTDGSRIRLGELLWRIQKTKALLSSTNINPRLALEILMLEM